MDLSEDAFVFSGTVDDLNANEEGSDMTWVTLTM